MSAFLFEDITFKKRYDEIMKKYMVYPRAVCKIIEYKKNKKGFMLECDIIEIDNIVWFIALDKSIDKSYYAMKLGMAYLALDIEREKGFVACIPLNSDYYKVHLIKPWSNQKCKEYLEEHNYEW